MSFLFITQVSKSQLPTSTQLPPSSRIIAGNRLSWDDFTGKVDSTSAYGAMTHSGVVFSISMKRHLDTAIINAKAQAMLSDSSWVKPDKKSPELLEHEQGHFNITVLLASEFERTIGSTTFFVKDYKEQIQSIYTRLAEKCRKMQLQYDEETNHMLNTKMQGIWNERLKESLASTYEQMAKE